ncbi:hypothetical protein [Devosia sp.]|uniref:hypothetical protein n=1 Tax=Devosia sp. TaxID=1871048 RepID=UPI003A90A9EB
MRVLSFLLLIAAIACTVAGGVAVVFGLVESEQGILVPGVLVMVMPWLAYLAARRSAKGAGRRGFEAALADGFTPDHQAWFNGSGLAIDKSAGRVLLADTKGAAVYPLADLEKLRFVPEQVGAVVPGAGISILSFLLTIFAFFSATAGHLRAGLFITTTGEGARTWHMYGIGKRHARAWIAHLIAVAPHVKDETEK